MKFVSIILTYILMSFLSLTATAETNEANKEFSDKVGTLVNEYYLGKSTHALSRRPPPCNDETGPSRHTDCIEAVCDKLGSFGCDSAGEINEVSSLCRGVSASCVNNVCVKLGSFGCDTMNEVREVTDICRDVFGGECMNEVCDRLGSFGCDTVSEVRQVGQMCRGRVDVDCIRSVCDRLGSFGCDTMSELEEVTRTCSGRRR